MTLSGLSEITHRSIFFWNQLIQPGQREAKLVNLIHGQLVENPRKTISPPETRALSSRTHCQERVSQKYLDFSWWRWSDSWGACSIVVHALQAVCFMQPVNRSSPLLSPWLYSFIGCVWYLLERALKVYTSITGLAKPEINNWKSWEYLNIFYPTVIHYWCFYVIHY